MTASVPKVALIHTVASLPAVFDELLARHCPGLSAFHLVDEALLQDTIRHGMLPRTRRRVVDYVTNAEESGAAAALVTCSSIGESAELARSFVSIPVLRIDEPMAQQAVAAGERIAVLATLHSTLQPTERLIRRAADRVGSSCRVTSTICDGAADAAARGATGTHDAIVAAAVERIAAGADVIVLAQASMARAVDAMPRRPDCPILTSPVSGVRQLNDLGLVNDEAHE
jgi:Asp/Glu/hydantoin racemase